MTFEEYTLEEKTLLAPYVSNTDKDTFTLNLPQAMGGAVMARYSRAPGSLRRVLIDEFLKKGEIDPKKADALIERVLIAYGDDSVAELAGGIQLCVENVSQITTKLIEDRRIGVAYIEQSSRYVVYDQKDAKGNYRYLQDAEQNPIIAGEHAQAFKQGMDFVFDTYCALVGKVLNHLRTNVRPIESMKYKIKDDKEVTLSELTEEKDIKAFKRTWEFDTKTKACDTARILLPAATLTNVGMACNGRAYQNMLTKLYSSELPEAQIRARAMHDELNGDIKRYVQRAKRDEYSVNTEKAMKDLANELFKGIKPENEQAVRLIRANTPFDDGIIASMLYKYLEHPYSQILDTVHRMPLETMEKIVETYLGERKSRRDRPGRALEHGYPLLFDIQGDYGIFRDLHRQRMLTQERQFLNTRLGFTELDSLFSEIGAVDDIKKCQEVSSDLYEKIRATHGAEIAQYPVLYGFNIRFMQGLNLRSAQHYLELRTGKQGHPSYRKICQEMARQLIKEMPLLGKSIGFVDYNSYESARADSEAAQRRKERKLGEE